MGFVVFTGEELIMRSVDFEEEFLQGLAEMGLVGNLGAKASTNPVQQLAAQRRQAAQATKQEKQDDKAAKQAAKQADQLAKQKTACTNRGGVWDVGRGACVAATAAARADASAAPKTPVKDLKAECLAKGGAWNANKKTCAVQVVGGQVVTQPTVSKTPVKDLKAECLAKGGAWNANKKTCAVQVVGGQVVAATPTNAAMCKAQNGTWYTASKLCVRPEDIRVCTAGGGSIDGRGRCQQPVGAVPAAPGKPAKPATAKATCEGQSGTWYPGAKKCVLPAELTACAAQGGQIVRGTCKVPPVKPVKPEKPVKALGNKAQCEAQSGTWYPGTKKCALPADFAACLAQGGQIVRGTCKTPTGAVVPPVVQPFGGTPPSILPTTSWPKVNSYINCLTKQRRGAKIGCPPPRGGNFQGPGWPEYFACLSQSVARGTNQSCVAPVPGAPIIGVQACPTGYVWDAASQGCKPTLQACPTGYSWDAAQNACVPVTVAPPTGGCPTGHYLDAATQTCLLPGGGGGGGGGGGVYGGGGGGGGGTPWIDGGGVGPDQFAPGGEGQIPGAAGVGTECDPGFNQTLPQEYNDQWGKMVVLQVFCAQAQAQGQGVPSDFIPSPQQADAFASTADTQEAQAITGSMGPMGVRPISSVEAEEMGGGSGGGGVSGLGW